MGTKEKIISLLNTHELSEETMKKIYDYVCFVIAEAEKAKRNAEYIAKIDKAAAQFEAGKGQIHELIEVEDKEVLAMNLDNRAIVLNPDKAEEFMNRKADPAVKQKILERAEKFRKNIIRDDRFEKE
ncbi:MAG: hypothetical protein IKH71_00725 [Oscillospiraceae bacterium]|nr:hypothetical protein [Oscillospiraceae bacterium]